MDTYTPVEPDSNHLHFRTKKLLNSHVIKHVLNRKEKWKNLFDPERLLRIRQSMVNDNYPVNSKDFKYIAKKYAKTISQIAYSSCMEGKNHTHMIEKITRFVTDSSYTYIYKQHIHVFDPQNGILIILSATYNESDEPDSGAPTLKYSVNTSYRLTKLAMNGSNNKSYIKQKLLQSSLIHPNCTLIADHR